MVDTIDLEPLPWDNLDSCFSLSELDWVHQYVRPSFAQQFEKDIIWELGKSWTKQSGFNRLPAPRSGQDRTVYDLFSPGSIDWEVQNGKLMVYINFQIDDEGQTRTTLQKKVKKEEEEQPNLLEPSCFESSSRTTSLEPLRQRGLKSPLPIHPIKRSRSDSLSPPPPVSRTSPTPNAEESGPATRTRRLNKRRPAQKRKRLVH